MTEMEHRVKVTLGHAMSRRALLGGMLGLGAAGLLAACGGGDDDDDAETTPAASAGATQPPQSPASPTAAQAGASSPTASAITASPTTASTSVSADASPDTAGSFPVTIDHKYGATTIEARPERIVSVGLVEQDALLALGVVPVATREWYGERPGAIFPWAEEVLGDRPLPEVLGVELDFEQVVALQPDVIIGLYAGLTPEEYDALSRIAPTVAQPEEYVDWGIPWNELTVKIGQILGQQAEAEELVAEVEARFTAVREEHPEFAGATGAVASPFGLPENYWVYNSQDARGRLMTALGFEVPEVFDEMAGEGFGATVSVEQVDLLADLDVLIWVATEDALADLDLYQSLPVVKEGRAIYFGSEDPVYDALSFSTVLSIPYAVDQLEPYLLAAIDGDPETQVS